jgi:hypothetical protein
VRKSSRSIKNDAGAGTILAFSALIVILGIFSAGSLMHFEVYLPVIRVLWQKISPPIASWFWNDVVLSDSRSLSRPALSLSGLCIKHELEQVLEVNVIGDVCQATS